MDDARIAKLEALLSDPKLTEPQRDFRLAGAVPDLIAALKAARDERDLLHEDLHQMANEFDSGEWSAIEVGDHLRERLNQDTPPMEIVVGEQYAVMDTWNWENVRRFEADHKPATVLALLPADKVLLRDINNQENEVPAAYVRQSWAKYQAARGRAIERKNRNDQ